MPVFSKLFYRFNLIPNKIPTSVIDAHRPQQIDSKIYTKKQRSKTQENTEEKSENSSTDKLVKPNSLYI